MAKCVVCETAVDVGRAEKEIYIDPKAIGEGVLRKGTLVVCRRKRCLRLVRETLAEMGRREVKPC